MDEQQFRERYRQHHGRVPKDVRIIDSYITPNGHMLLVFMYQRFILCFVHRRFPYFKTLEIGLGAEEGAKEFTEQIAMIIGTSKT